MLAEREADHQTARDNFKEALALADQTQMPLLKAQTLTSYGVFLCRGDRRSALPAAEALRIADGRHTQICRCQKAAVPSAAALDAEATPDAGNLRI